MQCSKKLLMYLVAGVGIILILSGINIINKKSLAKQSEQSVIEGILDRAVNAKESPEAKKAEKKGDTVILENDTDNKNNQ